MRVISVGEEITGTLTTLASEMLFELTAPSDGTLIVELSGADLQLEGVYWPPMWRPPSIYSTVATLQVAAGRTVDLSVRTALSFDYYYYEERSFVLRTSLTSGVITLPVACENSPPASNWFCVNGGWVPAGHPLDPFSSPPPPTLPAPPPPSAPPVQCTTADPFVSLGGGTCCNGGWRPPGMACGGTPPPPPPPDPSTCTTPDPFLSLGGGTCCGGGWRPPGMACG